MDIQKSLINDIIKFKKSGKLAREWDVSASALPYGAYVSLHGDSWDKLEIPEHEAERYTNRGEAFARWKTLTLPGMPLRARDTFDYVFLRSIPRRDAAKILGVSRYTVDRDINELKKSIADFCGIRP